MLTEITLHEIAIVFVYLFFGGAGWALGAWVIAQFTAWRRAP